MGGLRHTLGWRAGGEGEVARIDGEGRRDGVREVKRVPLTQKGDLGAEEEKEEDEGPRG